MHSRLIAWRQDITAGAIGSIVSLPVCVASGVLACELKKSLLLCEVPSAQLARVRGLFGNASEADELIKPDLDSALEWMEEKSLLLHADKRSQTDVLAFSEIDFLAGIEQSDLDRLSEVLTRREFAPGETICREGDDGDRMWLLAKGSVSVRLKRANGRQNVRIASLA